MTRYTEGFSHFVTSMTTAATICCLSDQRNYENGHNEPKEQSKHSLKGALVDPHHDPVEAREKRADDDRVRHAHFQHSTRTVNSRAWAATSRAASFGSDGAVS